MALVIPAVARSECHDELRPRLVSLAAAARGALDRLGSESTRAARRVDGAIQELDGGLEAIRALRRLNCSELRATGAALMGGGIDPSVSGDARVSLQLQMTYVFYRLTACRARDAKRDRVPSLESEDPAAVAAALRGLAELRGAFLETLRNERAAGEDWLAARDGLRSALSPASGLLEELRAACGSCAGVEGTTGPSPAARSLSDVTVRIVHDIVPAGGETEGAPEGEDSGSGGVDAPVSRTETEAERLLRRRRARTRAALRHARDETRREEAPARLRSRAELVRLSREALDRAAADEGRIPESFDWALLRAELDARERRPPIAQGDFDADRERWRETIDRLREIASGESDPALRLSRAARLVAAEYLAVYTEANGSPLDAFSGAGANCQVSTTLLVSALSQVPGLVPPGYELGIQVFNGHVQAVVVPSDPSDTRVWDLLTNTRTERREAPIYRPALAIRGYLERGGVRTGVADSSLLLREASPDRTRGIAAPDAAEVRDSQGWAEVAPDFVFSASPNPAHAVLGLPAVGEPAAVSRTPSTAVVAPPLAAPEARALGTGGGDLSESQIDALEARIADPAVRRAYEEGLVFIEDLRANPAIPSAELAASARARLYREIAATGRARGVAIREASDQITNDCQLLAVLGSGCSGDPVVADGIRRLRRRFEAVAGDPERLIAGIDAAEEMQAIYRRLGRDGMAGPGVTGTTGETGRSEARAELDRLGRTAIFPEAALSLEGASRVAGGREFDVLNVESVIEDGSPSARLLDWVVDPANVAPDVGGSSPTPPPRAGRSRAVPAGARATYEIGPQIYREFLLQYATMRAGRVTEREDALRRAIALPSDASPDARRFTVCGNIEITEWEVDGILAAARAIHPERPALPCPGGVSEEEFRALDGAYLGGSL